MSFVKFIKTTQGKYNDLSSKVAGAIYFALADDGTSGKIWIDGNCYGEANAKGKTVLDAVLETEGAKKGQIKITYTDGSTSYIALPEGKVYTAGDGINISDTNVISALDELIGSDITVTQATGALDKNAKITKEMTIKDVLMQMLQKELQPSIVSSPAVKVTMPQAKAYEVGTKVTPSYSASLSAGSYTYGPVTGITAKTWSVTDGVVVDPLTTASGTFAELTVGDSTNYKITATATYDAGVKAVTNLNNETSVQIPAGSASSSTSTITGFRSYFYGTKFTGLSAYTSADVRALLNGNSAATSGKKFNVNIPAGTRQVVIAVPAPRILKSVINVGLSRGEVADTFVSSTVSVEGVNGYEARDYNVFVFDSSTSLDSNTYEVTLG